MSRSRGIWLIVTCLGVALGCGDATAPTGTLEVFLTPATVRRSYYDSTQMRVSFRNGTPSIVQLAFETAIAQVETSPDVWLKVAGGDGYYLDVIPGANDIAPNAQRSFGDGPMFAAGFPDIRPMPAGRYRLVFKYVQLNAKGSPASSYSEAYSNPMVIVP